MHASVRRYYCFLFAVFVLAGAMITAWWLDTVPMGFGPTLRSTQGLVAFFSALVVVFLSLGARWLRWHYLLRRYSPRLATRDSVAIFFSTAPAAFTPLGALELARGLVIRRRLPASTGVVLSVWLWERLADVAVLGCFFLWNRHLLAGLLLLLSLGGLGLIVMHLWRGRLRRTRPEVALPDLLAVPVVLAASLVSWLLLFGALSILLSQQAAVLPFGQVVHTYAASTLGLSGLPLTFSLTGSALGHQLAQQGVALQSALYAVAQFRLSMVWFPVVLGLGALFVWRRRLLSFWGPSGDHFDSIASSYQDQIPAPLRQRLLQRKIDLQEATLRRVSIQQGARGLDLGCGQGWYLHELDRRGYDMTGIDLSLGQLRRAQAGPPDASSRPALLRATGAALPFGDGSFDFVYSINVLHHVTQPEVRARLLGEVLRVLRPGGVFLMHETNTINPLFRLYLGYLFPLLRSIDEGTESWIRPDRLPPLEGGAWRPEIAYFTFLPDFLPWPLARLLEGLEAALERSRFRRLSAHYLACLAKAGDPV